MDARVIISLSVNPEGPSVRVLYGVPDHPGTVLSGRPRPLKGSPCCEPVGVREEISLQPRPRHRRRLRQRTESVSCGEDGVRILPGNGCDPGGHLLKGEALWDGESLGEDPALGEVPQDLGPGSAWRRRRTPPSGPPAHGLSVSRRCETASFWRPIPESAGCPPPPWKLAPEGIGQFHGRTFHEVRATHKNRGGTREPGSRNQLASCFSLSSMPFETPIEPALQESGWRLLNRSVPSAPAFPWGGRCLRTARSAMTEVNRSSTR